MNIKKSCSNTRPLNWTLWSLQKTPPSFDLQLEACSSRLLLSRFAVAAAEFAGRLTAPAFEGSLERFG
jgi:hypothetical protein